MTEPFFLVWMAYITFILSKWDYKMLFCMYQVQQLEFAKTFALCNLDKKPCLFGINIWLDINGIVVLSSSSYPKFSNTLNHV